MKSSSGTVWRSSAFLGGLKITSSAHLGYGPSPPGGLPLLRCSRQWLARFVWTTVGTSGGRQSSGNHKSGGSILREEIRGFVWRICLSSEGQTPIVQILSPSSPLLCRDVRNVGTHTHPYLSWPPPWKWSSLGPVGSQSRAHPPGWWCGGAFLNCKLFLPWEREQLAKLNALLDALKVELGIGQVYHHFAQEVVRGVVVLLCLFEDGLW